MENSIENILTRPIQLTDTLRRLANQADSYRQECAELRLKAELLAQRLRNVARASSDGAGGVCRRPLRRIMEELEKSVEKALVLVRKCKRNGVIKRVITITSANDFKRVNLLLDNAIADIAWLLNVSASGGNRIELMGLPPIASSDPMMGLIWEQIAVLQRGTEEQREDAAKSLGALARQNDRFANIIVEEDAVAPLLKVLADGMPGAREAAARALGHIAKDANYQKQVIADAVAPVFVNVLISAPMKVQAGVAWALAQMVGCNSELQDIFLEHGAIRPLVVLLSEALQQPENVDQAVTMYTLASTSRATSKAREVATRGSKPSNKSPAYRTQQGLPNKLDKPLKSALRQVKSGSMAQITEAAEQSNRMENGSGLTPREINRRDRENENSEVKADLKAEVAHALWVLAKGNPRTSMSITETKALLCFATLIEKSKGAVQLNSVMAVTELAAVAEEDVDLRRSAFKMSSPAVKAVLDQLLRLVDQGHPDLLVSCIRAIGCLSRTFPARETRVVKSLVKHLEGADAVSAEAVMALEKFACKDNFLHVEHSHAIVEASGAAHLVQLIYFGNGQAQISAAILMCYLVLHVGENAALAKAEPLPALKQFAKIASLSQHPTSEKLLWQAINHLEIFQEQFLASVDKILPVFVVSCLSR